MALTRKRRNGLKVWIASEEREGHAISFLVFILSFPLDAQGGGGEGSGYLSGPTSRGGSGGYERCVDSERLKPIFLQA